jgi:DNA-binding CsgD family transcriptional regulator
LSTYQIAARTGVDRQRVTRALRKAGVPLRPRGAGRLRPVRRIGDPPDLPRLLRELYEEAQLGSRQIAAILGLPERTVRSRLRRYGIKARSRGCWNREDRTTVSAGVLEALYIELGMTAAEIGQRLGVSGGTVLRSAHALGVPVRSGGVAPLPGPQEIELVRALYTDPLIAVALTEHGVPRGPAGGSLSQRFPVPVRLTTPLVKDLYWECGTGLNHIELLTGQPGGASGDSCGAPKSPCGTRAGGRRSCGAGGPGCPQAPPGWPLTRPALRLRRWRSARLARLVEHGECVPNGGRLPGKLAFPDCGLRGRGGPQFLGRLQSGLHPAGGLRVPLLHGAGQGVGRLRQPVLQVRSGPAELAFHQAGDLAAEMLAGTAAAQLARKPASDGSGQQLGLPGCLAGRVEEPAVFGEPAAGFRHRQVQA